MPAGPDPGWTLRPATPDDASDVVAVIAQGLATYRAFAPVGWEPPADVLNAGEIADRLEDPRGWSHVAVAGGEVCGFARFRPADGTGDGADAPDQAHLAQLFVRRDVWGTGLATALLRAAVDAMPGRGFARARLFAAADQARARAFYVREGWTTDGARIDGTAFGLPLLRFAIELPRRAPAAGA